jgi:GT2 family glycosyltransferase
VASKDRYACVVPSYGNVALTQSVVRAALLELPPGKVVVVDNGGDYAPVGGETVISPGENLGWLRGCNLGMTTVFGEDPALQGVILLNNDVTLSSGFFTGLMEAAEASPGAGLVAPCYDDNFKSQHRYWSKAAADFPARPVEVPVQLVDGTCLLVTRQVAEQVGYLDETHFGRFSWGSEADLCARTRKAGLQVLVTQRSYLNHDTGSTARGVSHSYHELAFEEMSRALTELYGPRWRRDLGYPRDGSGRGGLLGLPYFALRRLRLKLGLNR